MHGDATDTRSRYCRYTRPGSARGARTFSDAHGTAQTYGERGSASLGQGIAPVGPEGEAPGLGVAPEADYSNLLQKLNSECNSECNFELSQINDIGK